MWLEKNGPTIEKKQHRVRGTDEEMLMVHPCGQM